MGSYGASDNPWEVRVWASDNPCKLRGFGTSDNPCKIRVRGQRQSLQGMCTVTASILARYGYDASYNSCKVRVRGQRQPLQGTGEKFESYCEFMLCTFKRKVTCRDQNAEITFIVSYSVMNLKETQSIEAKHENHLNRKL
jgi:hypothetical protein